MKRKVRWVNDDKKLFSDLLWIVQKYKDVIKNYGEPRVTLAVSMEDNPSTIQHLNEIIKELEDRTGVTSERYRLQHHEYLEKLKARSNVNV